MYRLLCFVLTFSFGITALSQDPLPYLSETVKGKNSDEIQLQISRFERRKRSDIQRQMFVLWKIFVLDSLGEEESAYECAKQLVSRPMLIKHPSIALVYVQLAKHANAENQFESAIDHLFKGLKWAEKYQHKSSICAIQRLLGLNYLKLEQYPKAELALKRSKQLAIGLNDTVALANALMSLGNALKQQDKIDEAIQRYSESLFLAKKLNNNRLIAGNYNNLGNAYRRKEQPKVALNYFNHAAEMNRAASNLLWLSFNYHNIANTYLDIHEYRKSIHYFTISNDLKASIKDSFSLISGYKSLSEAYAKTNNFNKAYRLLLQHVQLKDTLEIASQVRQINELELKYETSKKEVEIQQLKSIRDIQKVRNESLEMRSKRDRNLVFFVVIFSLAVVVAAFFFWRSGNLRKRANALLNAKNEQIELSNSALQVAINELSLRNVEITDSIRYAKHIQDAFLPELSGLRLAGLKFETFYKPKDIVSGDFYFYYPMSDQVFFGIADCTGHGVPGAMVSIVGMNTLEKVIRSSSEATDVSQILEHVNQLFTESLEKGTEQVVDGMDMALCAFNSLNMSLSFSGANQSLVLIRSVDSNESVAHTLRLEDDRFQLFSVAGTKRPIGLSHNYVDFVEHHVQLVKGDRLVLFSDGLVDQIGGPKHKKVLRKQCHSWLLESSHLSVEDQLSHVKDQFNFWVNGQEQTDDVCLLIVEVG